MTIKQAMQHLLIRACLSTEGQDVAEYAIMLAVVLVIVVANALIAPAQSRDAQEFAFATEESDDEVAQAELLKLRTRGLARQAVMDPKHGLEL